MYARELFGLAQLIIALVFQYQCACMRATPGRLFHMTAPSLGQDAEKGRCIPDLASNRAQTALKNTVNPYQDRKANTPMGPTLENFAVPGVEQTPEMNTRKDELEFSKPSNRFEPVEQVTKLFRPSFPATNERFEVGHAYIPATNVLGASHLPQHTTAPLRLQMGLAPTSYHFIPDLEQPTHSSIPFVYSEPFDYVFPMTQPFVPDEHMISTQKGHVSYPYHDVARCYERMVSTHRVWCPIWKEIKTPSSKITVYWECEYKVGTLFAYHLVPLAKSTVKTQQDLKMKHHRKTEIPERTKYTKADNSSKKKHTQGSRVEGNTSNRRTQEYDFSAIFDHGENCTNKDGNCSSIRNMVLSHEEKPNPSLSQPKGILDVSHTRCRQQHEVSDDCREKNPRDCKINEPDTRITKPGTLKALETKKFSCHKDETPDFSGRSSPLKDHGDSKSPDNEYLSGKTMDLGQGNPGAHGKFISQVDKPEFQRERDIIQNDPDKEYRKELNITGSNIKKVIDEVKEPQKIKIYAQILQKEITEKNNAPISITIGEEEKMDGSPNFKSAEGKECKLNFKKNYNIIKSKDISQFESEKYSEKEKDIQSTRMKEKLFQHSKVLKSPKDKPVIANITPEKFETEDISHDHEFEKRKRKNDGFDKDDAYVSFEIGNKTPQLEEEKLIKPSRDERQMKEPEISIELEGKPMNVSNEKCEKEKIALDSGLSNQSLRLEDKKTVNFKLNDSLNDSEYVFNEGKEFSSGFYISNTKTNQEDSRTHSEKKNIQVKKRYVEKCKTLEENLTELHSDGLLELKTNKLSINEKNSASKIKKLTINDYSNFKVSGKNTRKDETENEKLETELPPSSERKTNVKITNTNWLVKNYRVINESFKVAFEPWEAGRQKSEIFPGITKINEYKSAAESSLLMSAQTMKEIKSWGVGIVEDWVQKKLDLNLMHLISNHLRLLEKRDHLPLKLMDRKLFHILRQVWFTEKSKILKAQIWFQENMGGYEGTRRSLTLCHQLLSYTTAENWKYIKEDLLSMKKVSKRSVNDIDRVLNLLDIYPDRREAYNKDPFFLDLESEFGATGESFSSLFRILMGKEKGERQMALMRIPERILSDNKWLSNKNVSQTAKFHGMDVWKVLEVGDALQIGNVDYSQLHANKNAANSMVASLMKYMLPEDDQFINWYECPERAWLIREFPKRYHNRLNELSKLASRRHLRYMPKLDPLASDSNRFPIINTSEGPKRAVVFDQWNFIRWFDAGISPNTIERFFCKAKEFEEKSFLDIDAVLSEMKESMNSEQKVIVKEYFSMHEIKPSNTYIINQ